VFLVNSRPFIFLILQAAPPAGRIGTAKAETAVPAIPVVMRRVPPFPEVTE